MTNFLGFIVWSLLVFFLVGIGATHGFSLEVYAGLIAAGFLFLFHFFQSLMK